jgi:hypothetical protein
LEFDFIVANLTKNVAVSEKKTREANQIVEGFCNEANFPFKGLVLNIKDIKKEFTPGEAKDQFIAGEGINPIIVSLDVDSHSLINSANLRRRSIYHSSVDNKYFYFPRRVGADPIDVSPELKYDFSSMSSANKNSIDHHVSGFDNHTAFINNIFSMFRRIETDAGKFKSAGSRTCAGRCKCHENDCQTTDGRSPQGGKRTGRCQKPLKNRDAGTKGSGKIEGKGI